MFNIVKTLDNVETLVDTRPTQEEALELALELKVVDTEYYYGIREAENND